MPAARADFARTKSAHDFGAAGADVVACSGLPGLAASPVTCAERDASVVEEGVVGCVESDSDGA